MKNPPRNTITISSVRSFFKKLPWFLGQHAFFVILILAFLSAGLGIFMTYNYIIKVNSRGESAGSESIRFREDIRQKILERWESGDQRINELDQNEYSNPFAQ